jgi:predicted GNAT family N-acyltransferase
MRRALELADAAGHDVVLDAQSPLRDWYERFGFVVSGDPFVEDGIPHLPMTRPYRPS